MAVALAHHVGHLRSHPLFYVIPLVLGLVLNRRVRLLLIAARCSTRPGVAALVRRGSTQRVIPKDDARRRGADTNRQAGAEAYHNGSVPLHPQPQLSSADTDPRGYPRCGDRVQTRSGEEGVRIAPIASLGN
jgi:hypothetical protein